MNREPADFLDRLEGEGGRALRRFSVEARIELLGRAAVRFQNPDDPLVHAAVAQIPSEAGLSIPVTRELLQQMARHWSPEALRLAVLADFPDPAVLEGFRPGVAGDRIRAVPPRLLVQIGAGNIPGTGATALLRGLLVGAPTLLKPGQGDIALSQLMAEAIRQESPPLSNALAVRSWVGGEQGEWETAALARADRVVVYGGWGAVEEVRRRLSPGVPLVSYGHRLSLGVVARSVLTSSRAPAVAEAAAQAISAYDQRGCVSPHALWVEEGGEVSPARWSEMLALALRSRGLVFPPTPDPALQIQMRHLRDASELRQAAGGQNRVFGGPAEGWMILEESDPTLVPSCLGRTIRVHPVADASQVPALLAPFRHHLQSCALEAQGEQRDPLASALAEAGVTRITTFSDQPWPSAGWRHDGQGPLASLVRWVGWEVGP